VVFLRECCLANGIQRLQHRRTPLVSFEWVQEFGAADREPRIGQCAGERPIRKTVVADARPNRERGEPWREPQIGIRDPLAGDDRKWSDRRDQWSHRGRDLHTDDGDQKPEDALSFTGSISGQPSADIVDISPVTIANGATVDIDGPSVRSVTFAGTTGTLRLEDPRAFTGVISGLRGADAIDLSGLAYGANVKATYSGSATGGTLTVTDGAKTARIALSTRR
jgi:hypothetical protein